MSTLSLRKIKHDSSAVDNITLDSNGQVGILATPTAPLTIGRVSTNNEGGQIDLCRSTDNASSWGIDVYGNTSTPSLRIIDNVAAAVRMQIDNSGRVTKPYQPAFRATNNNTNQPLTANTEAVVQYNAAETNIGSNYNTSTYRFTAPVSGFYHFSASILVSKAASTRIDIMFKKNGSYWVSGELQALSSTSTNCLIANSMDGYLSAGDYVDVWTRINDNGSIYQEPKFWNFSGFLVG